MPTLRLRIHGRVQGVSYRAWTVGQAKKRGLSGWVRNRTDGTVEALISGSEEAVESMVAACHEGPLAARVEKIDVEKVERETAEDVVEFGFVQKSTV